ncbi:enoyl-CoA hydratase/isomerase family protein [Agrobacterium sp. NPDC090273]|uniref:enoyl-CoA hydratase/isomerase family protein n=1 Tax=Agrobacterium sp. NPDC090273 TaxID=3363919 RepID=UPI00383BCAE8
MSQIGLHHPLNEQVIFEKQGSSGHIRLNRPNALNSLTLPMVQAIAAALDNCAADPEIASVVILGNGERGFCAGGDIRALHNSGSNRTSYAQEFWQTEFLVNQVIANYPKPYLAIMDGITMGGGVGLSAHGNIRIVTERTRLAMPETGIGYFPDVGATWLLSRGDSEIGTYLGLTGVTVGAADAILAGLADYYVHSSDLPGLIDAISRMPSWISAEKIREEVIEFAISPPQARLEPYVDLINRTFAFDKIEAIRAALRTEDEAFAASTMQTLDSRSPTSLKLTLRLLRLGRTSSSLATCLDRELGACLQILETPDFYEGVRAAVIDKDRHPRWVPNALDAVDDNEITAFLRLPKIDAENIRHPLE